MDLVNGTEEGYLSQDDIRAIIDNEARRRLSISGDEFLAQYCRGMLDDPWGHGDLLVIASVLDDPLRIPNSPNDVA